MIYINDKIAVIDDVILEDMISSLPAWRRAQLLRIKHLRGRVECAAAYLLLCDALCDAGHDLLPTFAYGDNGKPWLVELPDVHFNLSHCKVAVACALSDTEVGIDVEVLGRYSEQLARHTMNDDELRRIMAADDSDEAFTVLWTMKEATMKLTGVGIGTNTRHILEDSYNIIYRTRVNREVGYVVTSAEWRKES